MHSMHAEMISCIQDVQPLIPWRLLAPQRKTGPHQLQLAGVNPAQGQWVQSVRIYGTELLQMWSAILASSSVSTSSQVCGPLMGLSLCSKFRKLSG